MGRPDKNSCTDPDALHDLFAEGLLLLGISLEEAAVNRLIVYFRELEKWNRTINLVSAAPWRDIVELHFLDSLALLPVLQALFPSTPLLDIGSGAGFPGLALNAAAPERPVTLVEPRAKRVAFLRHIVRTLSLTRINVQALHLSSENSQQPLRIGTFPAVTSRAVADLRTFLPLAASFCEPGGYILCMKAKKAEEEIKDWLKDAPSSFLQLHLRHPYTLPFSRGRREIIVFRKG